jgi:hypothetical protein
MTKNQATSGGRPSLVSRTYVARRPLSMEGGVRQPGELVPEAADWSGKARQCHLDLQWLEEVVLTNDADREAFQRQWESEESAREEVRKNTPAPEPPKPRMGRPGYPKGTIYIKCANCYQGWAFPPGTPDNELFDCYACGQWQTVDQARRGTLQKGGTRSHTVNHNYKRSHWRQTGS